MQVMVAFAKKLRKKIAERPSQDPISRMRSGSSRSGPKTRRQSVILPVDQSVVNSLPSNHGRGRRRSSHRTISQGRFGTGIGRASLLAGSVAVWFTGVLRERDGEIR